MIGEDRVPTSLHASELSDNHLDGVGRGQAATRRWYWRCVRLGFHVSVRRYWSNGISPLFQRKNLG